LIIDLHTHTYPRSDDSNLTLDTIIYQAKSVGLDGICLTEHDDFWDKDYISHISKKNDLLILTGVELNTENQHILVFGLHDYVFGMHKPNIITEMVDDAKAAMIIAHPYRRKYIHNMRPGSKTYSESINLACTDKLFNFAHGIEICNGRGTKEENTYSAEIANILSKSGTGGSDAHDKTDLGSYATEFFTNIYSLKELIEELRQGRFRAVKINRSFGT